MQFSIILTTAVITAAVTYIFTRFSDNRKIKLEKSEKVYDLFQKLLFNLNDLHILKELFPDSPTDFEVKNKYKELHENVQINLIYIDFILKTYLKPLDGFYAAGKTINQYISKKKEFADLLIKNLEQYEEIKVEYYKKFDDIRDQYEEEILKTMNEIKINAANMFFLKKIRGLFKNYLSFFLQCYCCKVQVK